MLLYLNLAKHKAPVCVRARMRTRPINFHALCARLTHLSLKFSIQQQIHSFNSLYFRKILCTLCKLQNLTHSRSTRLTSVLVCASTCMQKCLCTCIIVCFLVYWKGLVVGCGFELLVLIGWFLLTLVNLISSLSVIWYLPLVWYYVCAVQYIMSDSLGM